MYLIAGLGNPGREYAGTRHNVGFEVLNKMAFDHNIEFKKMKCHAAVAEGVISGQNVLLAKPHTYMNLSGESIGALVRFYKIMPDCLIVCYDDCDIPVGDIRIRKDGSAGGHNGVKSIIQHCGTEFIRVRAGIGKRPNGYDLADYVLSKFSSQETEKIIEGIEKAQKATEMILKEGIDAAMNAYNKRIKQEKE